MIVMDLNTFNLQQLKKYVELLELGEDLNIILENVNKLEVL